MTFTPIEIDRIIEMAWEDRTPFDAIYAQFGIKEAEVKKMMQKELKKSSYIMWRKRVEQSVLKHSLKRMEEIKRFKCSLQKTISNNKIAKR
ncbi:MAG: TIGR03643 family protein [Bacteroidia bacterium]